MINTNIYTEQYERIPEALKDTQAFLNYKLVRKNDSSDKFDKVPYSRGRKASTTDPDAWLTYDEALTAYETGAYDGIGVVLIEVNDAAPLCCIDLDDSRDPVSGSLSADAEEIVKAVNGWTEISASGKGIHIFSLCDVKLNRTRTHGIEIYQRGRFIALTGNVLPGSIGTIENRTAEIEALYDRYFPKVVEASPVVSSNTEDIDFESRFARMLSSKSGAKIKALMAGDVSSFANDHSAADSSLMAHLAFWFERDPYLMEQAFERSELSKRDKWRKRKDYRDRTIQNAIARTQTTYTSRTDEQGMTDEVQSVTLVKPKEMSTVDVLSILKTQRPDRSNSKPTYLLEPEILEGGLIMVYGAPACGKSTLVMSWCYEIAKTRNVLYLDRDNPQSVVHQKLERFGPAPEKLHIWGLWNQDDNGDFFEPPTLNATNINRVRKMVMDLDKPLVIFDTFATFAECDENDNSQVSRVFGHLKQLTKTGATVILIHHTGKNESLGARGGSAMPGAVDVEIKVTSKKQEGKIKYLTADFTKTRLESPQPVTYELVDGLPKRVTKGLSDNLLVLLEEVSGISKEDFERLAMKKGYKRNTIRDFLDNHITGGMISHSKKTGLEIKKVSFAIDELDEAA